MGLGQVCFKPIRSAENFLLNDVAFLFCGLKQRKSLDLGNTVRF